MSRWYRVTTKKLKVAAILLGLSMSCMAQEQSLNFVKHKLEEHRSKTLQEKLFVHTDKKTYIAGEYLWFKVYYVEGYTHQPIHLSRLAYLELLNGSNQPVLQARVSLKEGEEHGSLTLPLDLPTGNYKVRAYTNWMKNFGPDFYFEKPVTIINPLSNAREKTKAPADGSNEINFFPEGGDLVSGLPSVLAFKGSDQYGRGLNFKGWILNESNDTITSFSPFKFGLGSIAFTPVRGHTYKSTIVFSDGSRLKKDLPQVQERGYVMHLQKVSPAQLQLEVRTNTGNNAGTAYLVAHSRQVVQVAEQTAFKNGLAVFTIDATLLEPGITHFTIFDTNRQPVAERLYFTYPRETGKANVQPDKKEYSSREKITIPMSTLDTKGSLSSGRFSLSVYRVDSVQVQDDMNIENHLLLTSDLAGAIEAPGYYFGQPAAEKAKAIDNLMLTQGWRRFRWQNVLNEKENLVSIYPPDVNGPFITAKVFNALTSQPVAGLTTVLSLPGKQYQVYFSTSDSAGKVQFELGDYYGNGEMILSPYTDSNSLYRLQLLDPFSEQFRKHPVAPLMLSEKNKDLISNYSIGMQVRRVYAGDSLNRLFAPEASDSFSFLGVADYTYELDQYTRFTTMEEVMREYVRPISVGIRNGKPHMILIDETDRTLRDENLLVMLDGVPVYEQDRVFSYDPLKVKKLQIIPRPFVMGQNYFFGVASFSTYEGKFDAFDLAPHLIALDYQGLHLQREFYTPTYDSPLQKASRLPDYRNTLYWNPDIRPNGNGTSLLSFYTSDQKGSYHGLLQGIDSNGQLVVQEFTFNVK